MVDQTTYLFDKNKNIIRTLSPDSITVSEQTSEINTTITHVLEARHVRNVDKVQFFGMKDIDDADNFLMYKVDVVEERDKNFTFQGTYIMFDDLNGRGGLIKDRRPQNEPVSRILPDILDGTGWRLGNVFSENVGTSNYYYANRLQAFWDFITKWNVEFIPEIKFENGKIVDKIVHIYDEIGVGGNEYIEPPTEVYGETVILGGRTWDDPARFESITTIPVGSTTLELTNPLRSVGSNRDRFFKDTDGLWKIYRTVHSYTFTGEEDWENVSSTQLSQYGGAYYRPDLSTEPNYRPPYYNSTNIVGNMINSHYITKNNSFSDYSYNDSSISSSLDPTLMPRFEGDTLEDTIDFLKNNNVEILYRLNTPNTEVLPQDVQDLLNNPPEDTITDNDNGKWYEYGDKLITVVKETRNTSIFTAFTGRGRGVEVEQEDPDADPAYGRRLTFEDVEWRKSWGDPIDKPLGQDFLVLPNATELYGYEDGSPRHKLIEYTDIDDPDELLLETYKHAVEESRPKVHFTSTVVDEDRATLGEKVRIMRTDMGIRYKTRIFRMVRDFKMKSIKSFEFGDKLIYTRAERRKVQEDEIEEQVKEIIETTSPKITPEVITPIINDQINDRLINYPTNTEIDTRLDDRFTNYPSNSEVDSKLTNYATRDYVDEQIDSIEVPTGDSMQVVRHGNTGDAERPEGATAVYWIGSVAPANAMNGDLWIGGVL